MKKPVVAFLLVFSSVLVLGPGQRSSVQPATKAVSSQASERLSGDTPKTTVLGNAFIAPKDWSIRVEGPATILEAPEGNSWIALVDVQAKCEWLTAVPARGGQPGPAAPKDFGVGSDSKALGHNGHSAPAFRRLRRRSSCCCD